MRKHFSHWASWVNNGNFEWKKSGYFPWKQTYPLRLDDSKMTCLFFFRWSLFRGHLFIFWVVIYPQEWNSFWERRISPIYNGLICTYRPFGLPVWVPNGSVTGWIKSTTSYGLIGNRQKLQKYRIYRCMAQNLCSPHNLALAAGWRQDQSTSRGISCQHLFWGRFSLNFVYITYLDNRDLRNLSG